MNMNPFEYMPRDHINEILQYLCVSDQVKIVIHDGIILPLNLKFITFDECTSDTGILPPLPPKLIELNYPKSKFKGCSGPFPPLLQRLNSWKSYLPEPFELPPALKMLGYGKLQKDKKMARDVEATYIDRCPGLRLIKG